MPKLYKGFLHILQGKISQALNAFHFLLMDLSNILWESCECRGKEYFWVITRSEKSFSITSNYLLLYGIF